MLFMRPRQILSLVLGMGHVQIALWHAGNRPRLVKSGLYTMPEGLSWDKPEALGKHFGQYLHAHHYNVKHVVAGLAGKWTLAKARTLPPSNAAAVVAMLNLAIEREYQGSAREWSFDFVTTSNTAKGVEVLTAAAPRNRLVQIQKMIQTAGLSLTAALPATLSLAMSQDIKGSAARLYAASDGTELAIWKDGRLQTMQRLTASVQSPEALAQEIKRILAMQGVSSDEIQLYHLSRQNQGENAIDWAQQLGLPVTPVSLGEGEAPAAVALGQAWIKSSSSLLDFQHSRLAHVAKKGLNRLQTLGVVVAALVLIACGYLGVDWYFQNRAINELQAKLALVTPKLTDARADIARMTHTRGWYDNRPGLLETMRTITLAYPTNGKVWTTSLIMRDDLSGTLAGKASDERAALDLLASLRATPGLSDVKLLYLRQADRSGKNVSFALNFNFTGKDQHS